MVYFEIVGAIREIESIAQGAGVRKRAILNEQYGGTRWRKMKGIARVKRSRGDIRGLNFTGMNPTELA